MIEIYYIVVTNNFIINNVSLAFLSNMCVNCWRSLQLTFFNSFIIYAFLDPCDKNKDEVWVKSVSR